MSDFYEAEQISERLKAYPKLFGKIKEILDLIEKEEIQSADDFEEALIPQVRGLGKEIVETWAIQEERLTSEELENAGIAHHSKKNLLAHYLRKSRSHRTNFSCKCAYI